MTFRSVEWESKNKFTTCATGIQFWSYPHRQVTNRRKGASSQMRLTNPSSSASSSSYASADWGEPVKSYARILEIWEHKPWPDSIDENGQIQETEPLYMIKCEYFNVVRNHESGLVLLELNAKSQEYPYHLLTSDVQRIVLWELTYNKTKHFVPISFS